VEATSTPSKPSMYMPDRPLVMRLRSRKPSGVIAVKLGAVELEAISTTSLDNIFLWVFN
jgi:hypothetical protein